MWEFNFADFGYFRFREKNFREFGFQTLLVGIIFRGFHVQYLKVTKNGSHLVVFVTLLQPISLKFSTVQKLGVNFGGIFVGGNLFSRDLIIADQ